MGPEVPPKTCGQAEKQPQGLCLSVLVKDAGSPAWRGASGVI